MARSILLTLAVFVIFILIVVVFIFGFRQQPQEINNSPTPTGLITTPQGTQSATASAPKTSPVLIGVRVSILKTGFSAKEVRIVRGSSVTFVNTDTKNHQIASNPHPAHTDYPSLNIIGVVKPGEEKSLVFPDPGTYSYHDHLNPKNSGQIIVE